MFSHYYSTDCLFNLKRFISGLSCRPGSIITDLELTFNYSVGQSNLNALLAQAVNDGKLGSMEVEEAVVRKAFSG